MINKPFWQINLNIFSLTLLAWIVLVFGCTGSCGNATDANAPKVERGRLKFVKSATFLNIGENPIFRNVKQYFEINGKAWSPKDDPKFADKMNWCDTSPNLKVEILRCFGDATESYKTTYILQLKGKEVDVQKLDEGVGSLWTNDDGRWLLFSQFFYNVETGEKIAVKGLPDSDYRPVQYVIAISPDMKTVVAMPDNSKNKEGAEEFVSLKITDTETGKVELRKASFTKYPWLTAYKNPENDIQPPPEPQRNFVWEKGADGKNKIVTPILLEDVKKK